MRYIIISPLPIPFSQQCRKLSQRWFELTGSQEALRYPPHLTLRTGLVIPDTAPATAPRDFLEHAKSFAPVTCKTQGIFAVSEENLTGFVGWNVELTHELLKLHTGLLKFTEWAKGPQGPFQPHISLAYGDLNLRGLETLQSELQHLKVDDFSWTIDRVCLYRKSNEVWVEEAGVVLQG